MFFSVKDLELRSIRFDETFPPGRVDLQDPALRQKTPLRAQGMTELKASLMEIRVRGHLRGRLEADCDRCLEAVLLEVDTDFDLSYLPASSLGEGDVELSGEESDIGFYEGDGLDLTEVVHEQVLLSLPMQRICRPDCKGICPLCGSNLNEGDCGCRVERNDPRWAALRDGRA